MPKETAKRAFEHMTSPLTVRSVLGVIMILSVLGFAYAVFNERRIQRIVAERNEQIAEVRATTQVTHEKTELILASVDEGKQKTKAELDYMKGVSAALHELSEQVKTYRTLLPAPAPAKPRPKTRRLNRPRKTCIKEIENRKSYGNSSVLIERTLVPVPCQ
jgi:hypothetical protein